MIRYFDTSALLPYYRAEAASAECEALLIDSDQGVALTELTAVEMGSALARLVRMAQLSEAGAAKIYDSFFQDQVRGRFTPVSIDARVYQRALDWLLLRVTPLRTLDALHLACAAGLGAELVTRDEVLARAARRFGVACIHVEDPPIG